MALPDITLQKGQVLLIGVESNTGIVMDNSPYLFGYIAMVNDLSDSFNAGEYILFDPKGADKFLFDNVNYYFTTEDKIRFKENYIPPL